MSRRNFERERKLLNDWSYIKPMGPHIGEDPENDKKNVEEMHAVDVQKLLEVGDAMAEYISSL